MVRQTLRVVQVCVVDASIEHDAFDAR